MMLVLVGEKLNEKQLEQKETVIKGNNTEMKNVNQRLWRGLLCILLFFYGQLSFACHHQCCSRGKKITDLKT